MISSRYLLAAALAAFSIAPAAGLAQSGSGPGVPLGPQSPLTREPLSRDAIRNAKPMPMPELSEEEGRQLFRGDLPPLRPEDATPQAEAMGRGNVRKGPLRWAGKLFHDLGGGSVSYCTAQFIDKNIIVTAAHCVVLDNGFIGLLEFQLQYNKGKFSKFYPIADFRYWSAWHSPGVDRWQWDYAILCTAQKSKTGHFGWEALWAKKYNKVTSIGYPAAIDKGEIIQVVSGPIKRYNPYVNVYELNQGVAKYTQGASGGAWVADYKGKNRVVSVNSFIFANRKGRMYGPYFDKDFIDLLNIVRKLPAC